MGPPEPRAAPAQQRNGRCLPALRGAHGLTIGGPAARLRPGHGFRTGASAPGGSGPDAVRPRLGDGGGPPCCSTGGPACRPTPWRGTFPLRDPEAVRQGEGAAVGVGHGHVAEARARPARHRQPHREARRAVPGHRDHGDPVAREGHRRRRSRSSCPVTVMFWALRAPALRVRAERRDRRPGRDREAVGQRGGPAVGVRHRDVRGPRRCRVVDR